MEYSVASLLKSTVLRCNHAWDSQISLSSHLPWQTFRLFCLSVCSFLLVGQSFTFSSECGRAGEGSLVSLVHQTLYWPVRLGKAME